MIISIKNYLKSAFEGFQIIEDFRLRYQSAVSFFMYVMLATRPDIAYVVSMINRYFSNFTESHGKAVKRIFRYFKGILNFQLIFNNSLMFLTEYFDIDGVDDRDIRRFIFGFVFNVDNDAINGLFKRQSIVTLSSCEAEYMNQTQTIKKAIWFFILLDQINFPKISINLFADLEQAAYLAFACFSIFFILAAIIIHCDNQKIIALIKNPQTHVKSKHIDIQ